MLQQNKLATPPMGAAPVAVNEPVVRGEPWNSLKHPETPLHMKAAIASGYVALGATHAVTLGGLAWHPGSREWARNLAQASVDLVDLASQIARWPRTGEPISVTKNQPVFYDMLEKPPSVKRRAVGFAGSVALMALVALTKNEAAVTAAGGVISAHHALRSTGALRGIRDTFGYYRHRIKASLGVRHHNRRPRDSSPAQHNQE